MLLTTWPSNGQSAIKKLEYILSKHSKGRTTEIHEQSLTKQKIDLKRSSRI